MSERRDRFARMLCCDHNPLRRRVDRIEASISAGLVIAFVLAAPLLGFYIGRLADNAGIRQQKAEQSWSAVRATLLQNASSGQVGAGGDWDTAWVQASWQAPAGGLRYGLVATPLNAHEGDRMQVWVTRTGRLTHEPLSRIGVLDRMGFAVITTVVGLAIVLSVIGACARMAVNRRRIAGWERGWASIGPRWTSLR